MSLDASIWQTWLWLVTMLTCLQKWVIAFSLATCFHHPIKSACADNISTIPSDSLFIWWCHSTDHHLFVCMGWTIRNVLNTVMWMWAMCLHRPRVNTSSPGFISPSPRFIYSSVAQVSKRCTSVTFMLGALGPSRSLALLAPFHSYMLFIAAIFSEMSLTAHKTVCLTETKWFVICC